MVVHAKPLLSVVHPGTISPTKKGFVMEHICDDVETCIRLWANKTLAQLHQEALNEPTKVAFDAIKVKSGPTVLLAVCIANPSIFDTQSLVAIESNTLVANWDTSSLCSLAVRVAGTDKLWITFLRSPSNDLTAAILIAADPCSVTNLAALLHFPS
jgi:hypothetical protein